LATHTAVGNEELRLRFSLERHSPGIHGTFQLCKCVYLLNIFASDNVLCKGSENR